MVQAEEAIVGRDPGWTTSISGGRGCECTDRQQEYRATSAVVSLSDLRVRHRPFLVCDTAMLTVDE